MSRGRFAKRGGGKTLKKQKKSINSTDLAKEGIRSGDVQDMVPYAHDNKKAEHPILSLHELRRIATVVKAIKNRLAAASSKDSEAPGVERGRAGDASGQASGPASGKDLEGKEE